VFPIAVRRQEKLLPKVPQCDAAMVFARRHWQRDDLLKEKIIFSGTAGGAEKTLAQQPTEDGLVQDGPCPEATSEVWQLRAQSRIGRLVSICENGR
jgi:hypothetical protein